MASNITDVISNVVIDIKELFLENGEELSEYEVKMISNSLELPYKSATNSKILLLDRIDEAIKCKSDLNYVIMKLKSRRRLVAIPYNSEYNKLFTILTRQGRPSRQAIDSEIHYTKPNMSASNDLLDKYDQIVEFLTNHLSILDLVIRNYESRKYEL